MKRNTLAFLLILLSVFIVASSCKESISNHEPTPGRRGYVWDVTEIKPGNESLYLTDMWGSLP